MKLTFHGGAGAVTGANYLLETADGKFLIDCGLHQGGRLCEEQNYEPFGYDPSSIDSLFITHAHIDHIGRAPRLYKMGFRGKVFSTAPTKEFAEELLRDSRDILAREAKRDGKKPLYNDADIDGLMGLWKTNGYHKQILAKDIKAEFYDAGHILGSSYIVIESEGKRIVFSGDLGNVPAPMLKDTEKITQADYALIESAYGGRFHEDLEERKQILEDVIENTVKRGGTLMIPAFAMERTQQVLHELNGLVEGGRIPPIPIFLDSPLAIKLTGIYRKYTGDPEYMDQKSIDLFQAGDAIFQFPGLKFTPKTEESNQIADVSGPKIIIAGSGMSNGGRITRHEARYLPDEKNTLLIVGYQAEGTLGRRLIDGAKEVKVNGQVVPIRAQIKAIGGYSAHADQRGLLSWLRPMRDTLRRVFIVQGEGEQMTALKQVVQDELAINATIPSIGESVEL
ncbi:MAG: MBL fold metallo-hydrolase [bacterium]|nr:MBL fold metallo-hydrolase [bacterium]MDZ4231473.1 MBL fold metallo-hydrolase [Patescibacteria group bacterium]